MKFGDNLKKIRILKKLSQEDLAEKVNVSRQSVSKWETGLSLPDADKMLDLCNILGINVNELLNGEKIDMEDYPKKTEELLIEMSKQEEMKNKELLFSMWIILIVSVLFYVGIILLAVNTLEEGVLLGTIICVSTIIFLIAGFIALKFEVDAGYFECSKCHHKYTPTYMQILFAPHIVVFRYFKCPKCGKRSWNRKVMTK